MVNVTYKYIKIKHWSKKYKAMCISNKDIYNASFNEINNIIKDYLSKNNISSQNIGKNINFDLYYSMKAWTNKISNSMIAVGTVEMSNMINIKTKEPFKFIEIVCISEKDKICIPVYFIENIKADGKNNKDNTVLYYYPKKILYNYVINQPIINIDYDTQS